MWFVRLVKMRKAPKMEEAEAMNKMMMDAAKKMAIKIHRGFMTLGQYDSVRITEADEVSGPMKMAMKEMDSTSETLVATSYEDAMKI